MRKGVTLTTITLLILAGMTELGIRLTGVMDFPIFGVDSTIGYVPKAEQSGNFLNRNNWSINEKGQGSPSWKPGIKPDLLLIGDSVVWGGNTLNDPDKLGYQLQSFIPDYSVWSASAGSWGILNTIAYLDRYTEIWPHLDHVVWVLNGGDFAGRSQWVTNRTHPKANPQIALLYVFNKYALPRILKEREIAIVHTPEEKLRISTIAALKAKMNELWYSNPDMAFTLILYTGKTFVEGNADEDELAFESKVNKAVKVHFSEVAKIVIAYEDDRWNSSLYRDGIHPSIEGNQVLAKIISESVLSNAAD